MSTLPERPSANFSTESFRTARPEIVGPEVPPQPFPIELQGAVQRGFGRGGKDLGCPTANLPDDALDSMTSVTQTGIYYGYARVYNTIEGSEEKASVPQEDQEIWPMVMSLGWNPYYKNQKLTAEVHILHEFKSDFYGRHMSVVVLGYIRPELDYTSREALIQDIETDKRVALNSLERPAYKAYAQKCPLPKINT